MTMPEIVLLPTGGGGGQEFHDRLTALRVEVPGRLVREENERFARNGASHGDTLLLAAGQLARQVLRAMGHADAFEGVARPAPDAR